MRRGGGADCRHPVSVGLRRPFHIGHSERLAPHPLRWPADPLRMNAGLCDTCKHQKVVRNTRGSVFSMCERSKTDAALPEVPAAAGEGVPGLRQRVSLTTVLPSSAMRTSGAVFETVPVKLPLGAAPPPAATALALPFSPAATRQLIS